MINGHILSQPFEQLEVDMPRALPLADGIEAPTHPQDVKDLVENLRSDPFYIGRPDLHSSVELVKASGCKSLCIKGGLQFHIGQNFLLTISALQLKKASSTPSLPLLHC
jgi:hypothetical protein